MKSKAKNPISIASAEIKKLLAEREAARPVNVLRPMETALRAALDGGLTTSQLAALLKDSGVVALSQDALREALRELGIEIARGGKNA